jgi:hypothetical protein
MTITMNNHMARTLTLAALAVGWLSPAYGQYVQRIIPVTIPFEFSVKGKSFPAGPYSIVCLAPNRLDLRDSRSRVLVSLITRALERRERSPATKLGFSTAGGGHALTEIWAAHDRFGYELAAPGKKTLVAKRTARGSVQARGDESR